MAHILLIEPNQVLAATYAQALIHEGYTVECVLTSQAALDAADGERPDVIVLELHIGEHNGVEFLHEFRSYGDWQTIPIILNTTIGSEVLKPLQETLKRDFNIEICLYKPQTSVARLLTAIKRQVTS